MNLDSVVNSAGRKAVAWGRAATVLVVDSALEVGSLVKNNGKGWVRSARVVVTDKFNSVVETWRSRA